MSDVTITVTLKVTTERKHDYGKHNELVIEKALKNAGVRHEEGHVSVGDGPHDYDDTLSCCIISYHPEYSKLNKNKYDELTKEEFQKLTYIDEGSFPEYEEVRLKWQNGEK